MLQGQWTTGGIKNFSKTISHRTWQTAGRKRANRDTNTTTSTSTVIVTVFWKSHQIIGSLVCSQADLPAPFWFAWLGCQFVDQFLKLLDFLRRESPALNQR